MLEQEIASIMRTVLEAADNPTPYYHNVPEDFLVPSVFFPVPELDSGYNSLSSYEITYQWFVKFFDVDEASVYSKASKVMNYIVSHRNLIPLYNEDGTTVGKSMRVGFPKLRKIEDGVTQIQINWNCVRPYYEESAVKMMQYVTAVYEKPDLSTDVALAYQTAINNFFHKEV